MHAPDGTGGCARPCCIGRSWLVSYKTRRKEDEMDDRVGHSRFGILYHGPRNDLPEGYAPKEVIELLNARKNDIYCVRGNCDTEVDQMVLEFPVLADYCVIAEGETAVYATHGHIYNEQKLPPLHPGDILLHGHTHVPKCAVHEEESYIYMNPGSVSLPKEDSWHGYMIWEDSEFVWKDFDGQEHMRKKLS